MDKKYITYTKTVEGKEIKCGVDLNTIVNWAYDGTTLYLFLDEQIEVVRIVQVPVKKKPTANQPSPWAIEDQARTIKESYTIEITEPEKIEKFLKYADENAL